MGIIILPLLLGASIVYVLSIINTIQMARRKELKPIYFMHGFTTAAIIYLLIVLSYVIEQRVSGLSPFFRFPIFMFFIPSLVALIARNSTNDSIPKLAKVLNISIVYSGTLALVFNDYVIGILDKLNVDIYH